MKKICVLGSINMDMVMRVDKLARRGETVLAKSMDYYPGGKGANQAVAARRLGTSVRLIGSLGHDKHGEELRDRLEMEGIDLEGLMESEEPTGLALINVDDRGENNIVVIPGANSSLDEDHVYEYRRSIDESDILISQLEIGLEAVEKAFEIAKNSKTISILNPAPARELPDRLLEMTDIIIPNETELEYLTGICPKDEETTIEAARKLLDRGVGCVIVTLGSKGAFLMNDREHRFVDAHKVEVVDTTAAGDSFVGGFAAGLNSLDFMDLYYAVKIANKAAAITVQKEGAQTSLPYLKDIKFAR